MICIPVVIVGAGPVGLFMGYLLSQYGIRSIIVEKAPALNNHPKSRSMNVRTMEILRLLDNFNELISFALPNQSRRFTWKYSLSGGDFYTIAVEDLDICELSPIQSIFLAQNYIERHIYKLIKEKTLCKVFFNHEISLIEKNDEMTTIKIFNNKTKKTISFISKFLIGADGTHSKVRELAHITCDNFNSTQSKCCNIYAKLDLTSIVRDDLSAGYFFANRNIMGRSILAVNGTNKWLFGIHYSDNRIKSDFTDKFCIEEIQLMTGIKNLPITIISKNFWSSRASIASQLKVGNIFLVGDSAHTMPPTGGLGLNTGLQDAHNLAWKLAFVINHSTSPNILNSYHDERFPVAKSNIEFSTDNAKRLSKINRNIFEGQLNSARDLLSQHHEHLNHLGLDLGMCYKSELISKISDILPPHFNIQKYQPSAYPGCRAPHIEIYKDNKIISALNLFQHIFTLIQGKDCPLNTENFVAMNVNTILRIYKIGVDFQCDENKWNQLYSMSSTGYVLVRPDGHVAMHQHTTDIQSEVLLIKYLSIYQGSI